MTLVTTQFPALNTTIGSVASSHHFVSAPNGTFWKFVPEPASGTTGQVPINVGGMYRSIDSGATWTRACGVEVSANANYPYDANAISFGDAGHYGVFIDEDGYLHILGYGPRLISEIVYLRGTPTGSGSTASWTFQQTLLDSGHSGSTTLTNVSYPSDGVRQNSRVIAHREGTGWAVHTFSPATDGTGRYIRYRKLTVSSAGVVSIGAGSYINASEAESENPYFDVDFCHTGNGKTIKDGTPHFLVAWLSASSNANGVLRAKKYTYSGGTWTAGTTTSLSGYKFTANFTNMFVSYTGSQFMIHGGMGFYLTGQGWSWGNMQIFDYSDATNTLLKAPMPGSSGYPDFGQSSIAPDGSLYSIGRPDTQYSPVYMYRWIRGGNHWEIERLLSPSPDDYTRAQMLRYGVVTTGKIHMVVWNNYTKTLHHTKINHTVPVPPVELLSPLTNDYIDSRKPVTVTWGVTPEMVGKTCEVSWTTFDLYTDITVLGTADATLGQYTYPANTKPDGAFVTLRARLYDGNSYGLRSAELGYVTLSSWMKHHIVYSSSPSGEIDLSRRTIKNFTFESESSLASSAGNSTNWTTSTVTRSTVRAVTGTSSAAVVLPASAARSGAGSNLHLSPGKRFRVEADVYVPTGTPDVYWHVHDNNTRLFTDGPKYTQKDQWFKMVYEGVSDGVGMRWYMIACDNTKGEAFYIDNYNIFELVDLPPATYEAVVVAADAAGYSPYSTATNFNVLAGPTTNVYHFDGTQWVAKTRSQFDGAAWKEHIIQKL